MPKRFSMAKIKESLRLHFEQKESQRMIAESLGIARSTVQENLRRFEVMDLTWEESKNLTELDFERLFFRKHQHIMDRPQPDCSYIHTELNKTGVTLQILWDEYFRENPNGYHYSHFCVMYKEWAKGLKVYMRQRHKGGEKVFVDYSGKRPFIVDRYTGEVKQVEIFVMAWGASHYLYAEVQESQKLCNWVMGHVRAFEYFGCTPFITVPDGLKSAVSKACRYDPDLNQSYVDLASHYGFGILPARPGKAKDKAKVEVGVLIIQRWILARLRNRIFHSIEEMNVEIRKLLDEVNNKPLKKLNVSRLHLFEKIDKPNANPLPKEPYRYHEWLNKTINLDYTIEVDKHYYSVPHKYYRKKRVDVRLTESVVEIFYKKTLRLAIHNRSKDAYAYSMNPDHMPEKHKSLLYMTPAYMIREAEKVGPNCGKLISRIIHSKTHPEIGIRPSQGILRLAKSFGKDRMEMAAEIGLKYKMSRVRQLREILKKGLDKRNIQNEDNGTVKNTAQVRGQSYFKERIEQCEMKL